MNIPGNGIFVVRGELTNLITSMKKNSSRWNSHSQSENSDKLTKSFIKLKETLFQIEDLKLVSPKIFLDPFLDVIRSEETTGPVTSLALSAINKFLAYGLIDPTNPNLAAIVESIADAVTHARFVGADQSSDGVVLLRIIQVLKTLMLGAEGCALTNESVCEIIMSCFRICFETRLNELLRRTAEHALKDMILLLFMRLPQFVEDEQTFNIKCLQIRPEDSSKKSKNRNNLEDPQNIGDGDNVDQKPEDHSVAPESERLLENKEEPLSTGEETATEESKSESSYTEQQENNLETKETGNDEYINSLGVRFTNSDLENSLAPYGIPCIRELFRFLISLCNPWDSQNTDAIMHIALNLLTIVFEVAADNLGNYSSLIALVKDDLCRNLIGLLNTERLSLFAANMQVCFLLFESLRSHLKFQVENYLVKLCDIISSENAKIVYETRELALENLLQLFRVPGFAAELYINYDCDLYCVNLFENITKMLSKNALSAAQTQSIYSTHLLSLESLLTIIEAIDKNCASLKKGNSVSYKRHSRNNSTARSDIVLDSQNPPIHEVKSMETFIKYNTMFSRFMGSMKVGEALNEEKLTSLKNKKRILHQGTELFNQRPEKGIQFLQENGFLNSQLDPLEIAHFLRENPGLDKKMIGEYISKKKNVESKILEVFVKSFDFTLMRIDKALRLYLETFRLPGEAPLIFLVMEHFAEHWHNYNDKLVANADAAFRLAYAIIMLNMDQHNHNAKKLNVPMTADDFVKNLRGLNDNADFDQDMLVNIYNSIKHEEIIMPAEQTGLVRENYLWKVLLRRGEGKDGEFDHVLDPIYDKQLFQITWGSTLAGLGCMLDKTMEIGIMKRIMEGFIHSAAISSHYDLHVEFDAIILTLCKFTTLYNLTEINDIQISVQFGQNVKARMALKSIFNFLHEYGDCMRESWKHVVDLIVQLYKLKLLPKTFLEVEDFCENTGKLYLQYEAQVMPKTEASLFSSLYSYLSSESQRVPNFEEQEIIKASKKCIRECQIDQIVSESKIFHPDSLNELIQYLVSLIKPPQSHKSVGIPYEDNLVIFYMEFLVKILIQNRDRVLPYWGKCSDQMHLLIMQSASCGYDHMLKRSTIALFKLAIYLMRNEELASTILQSLKIFLRLRPKILLQISLQVAVGMYELLKTSAQNIHSESDWAIVFSILESVGAGAIPADSQEMQTGTKSDGALSSEDEMEVPDRGYISDSEITTRNNQVHSPQISPQGDAWIIVDKPADSSETKSLPSNNTIIYTCKLTEHSPVALVKCWESLAFVVRNVAHITPYNFEICVKCIRTFVEASLNGSGRNQKHLKSGKQSGLRQKPIKSALKNPTKSNMEDDKGDSKELKVENDQMGLPERYQTIAIQLLDLMHTLHTRTAQIFRWWAEEGSVPQCNALWSQGWCPLLQGIARISTDYRRQVRTSAVTCLQRALLMHDLQTLTGPEWAGCFRQVLFPLMNYLLNETPALNGTEQGLIEESRIRIATIMSKVFLHHLNPLMTLQNFNELWLDIIFYLEKFMKVGSDMLAEAVLESLKNMLLVMYSVKAFHSADGQSYSTLWELTWRRISEFLPNLKDELFKSDENPMLQVTVRTREIPSPQQIVSQSPTTPPAVKQFIPYPQQTQHVQSPQPPQILSSSPEHGSIQIQHQQIMQQSSPQQPMLQEMPVTPQHSAQSILLDPILHKTPQSNILLESPVQNYPTFMPPKLRDNSPPGLSHPGKLINLSANLTTTPPSTEVSTESPTTPDSPPELVENISNIPDQNFDQMEQHSETESVVELVIQSDPIVNNNSGNDNSMYEKSLESPDFQRTEVKIPESHQIQMNVYPGVTGHVPIDIVKSFAPISPQHHPAQPQQLPTNGSNDIYNDYIQDPYNLTLQNDPNFTTKEISQNTSATSTTTTTSIFQSASYFGNDSSDFLFNRP